MDSEPLTDTSKSLGHKNKGTSLPYGNFQDPFGLARRMLASKGGLGKQALALELLAKSLAPVSLALQLRERQILDRGPRLERPLLLVVGAPRTGTTLVSQALANCFDVGYFTNLNAMFPRAPLAAETLFGGRHVEQDYDSLYGVTAGLAGINAGFHFWDRFLGSDRYAPAESLSAQRQRQLLDFFQCWCGLTGKPFLNKNNRNLACAEMLAEALPNAVFLCVNREPLQVVQSLIQARKWVQGDPCRAWGLFAEAARDDSEAAVVDAVCNQVERNLQSVTAARRSIPSERWLEIEYESFCGDPVGSIDAVRRKFSFLQQRPDRPKLAPFAASSQLKLSAASLEQAGARLGLGECEPVSVGVSHVMPHLMPA